MILRSTMSEKLPGMLCLLALSGLTFVLASGCSQSEAAPAPPSIGAETAPIAKGPKVDAEQYVVEIKAAGEYKAAKEGTVEVTLVPKGVYHINTQFPAKFKAAEPADGVTYSKVLLKREDGKFDEKKGSFTVPFVAAKAGKAKVGGTLHFSVCSESQCVMDKKEIEVAVDVK